MTTPLIRQRGVGGDDREGVRGADIVGAAGGRRDDDRRRIGDQERDGHRSKCNVIPKIGGAEGERGEPDEIGRW